MVRDLKFVGHSVAASMDEIMENFKPGAAITVIVRRPGAPTQDFMMTTETDLDEVIAALERAKTNKRAEIVS